MILFDFNYDECIRGITKCLVLKPEQLQITLTERNRLLAVLWFVITQTFDNEDYSLILDRIAQQALGEKDFPDLPFQ